MKLTATVSALLMSTILSVAAVPTASAEDHSLSTIQGTQIDLKAYDHAFAGSIKDFVAFGALDEETGSSELTMKKDGQIIRTTFKREDGRIGGVIRHTVEDRVIETSLQLVKIDRESSTILFNINGQEVALAITADGFENNHFVNPTYRTTVGGEEISYRLQGRACFGFSTHLGFMILGAYLH